MVTWIDINAPYYPEYATPYPQNLYGRSPLDAGQLERLWGLTGRAKPDRPQACLMVNFTRPELSPCLAKLAAAKGPAYQEALAIIRGGQQRLAARPNPDRPGFQFVSEADLRREAKYEARRMIEARMRAAIGSGRKLYDKDAAAGQPVAR